ncbi:MAG: hypothetical protein LBF77_06150 [Spirochaetaceae bacterium]|jgi:hypothetical protein|nr:hypothetical protein [Spirochaetaceae bacterium]
MTRKEAKELSLEVWRYLAGHPEIRGKKALPLTLFRKIRDIPCHCPLCGLFIATGSSYRDCPGCPLSGGGYYCGSDGHPYDRWNCSLSRETGVRKEAAEEIVRVIEAWEAEE